MLLEFPGILCQALADALLDLIYSKINNQKGLTCEVKFDGNFIDLMKALMRAEDDKDFHRWLSCTKYLS